ncbi:MAG: ATP-binding protein [Spartobacteria bacterium]
MKKSPPDQRVLVVAPVGPDARVMDELLSGHGFNAQVCTGPEECCVEINSGAGALVLTEEALEMGHAVDLFDALQTQAAWSNLPVIILTTGGAPRRSDLLARATSAAGGVTLLERPIAATTLLRSVEVALNSRRRQYLVRDLLEEQRDAQAQLRQAHEQLAGRAGKLESLVRLRTAKLAESNEQLRREIKEREQAEVAREALRRQLLNAQEEERRRIARELHDQMGQNLTALNLGLKSLGDAEATSDALPALLRPLQELAAQTARDVHRVALELRPSTLDDLGLVKSLRTLLDTWSAQCQIKVDFETGRYQPTGISAEIKTTLYRVIQELLTNIAKHANAAHVSLVLQRDNECVQGTMEDDGDGFDVARALREADGSGRLGLVGIQERLGLMNGSFTIESDPGHGSTFLVRIPVPRS